MSSITWKDTCVYKLGFQDRQHSLWFKQLYMMYQMSLFDTFKVNVYQSYDNRTISNMYRAAPCLVSTINHMFPVPRLYVSLFLYSPVHIWMFPSFYWYVARSLHFPVPMFPSPNGPQFLCSPIPMFLSSFFNVPLGNKLRLLSLG